MEKLLVANWKCNPADRESAEKLFKASDEGGVIICPPFVYLPLGKEILKNASLGVQDIFWEEGAHTGEVSVSQVRSVGAQFAIVGHSERRAMGETDEITAKKVSAVINAGLTAIVCVGEPKSIREEGNESVEKFISSQLMVIRQFFGSDKLIIAYEPIWAIGSDNPATPEAAAQMATFIRSLIGEKTKVLYGGSVSAKDIIGFAEREEIDGFLIGRSSAKEEEFKKIISELEA